MKESIKKILTQFSYQFKGTPTIVSPKIYNDIPNDELEVLEDKMLNVIYSGLAIPAGPTEERPNSKNFSDRGALRFNTNKKTLEWAHKTVIKDRSNSVFGYSCSISGDWMVVGAKWENTNGLESGASYMFYNNGGTWVETQKLLASDGKEYDGFGTSCVISGNWVVVGAPYYTSTNGNELGAAYVFYNSGGTWVETQKLLASDGEDEDDFGYSCAISGNWMVVGSPYESTNGVESGASYVFYNSGGTWVETQKLLASDGNVNNYFGYSCSISGDWMVVGAYGEGTNGSYAGASYVFYNSGGTWVETQKLLASDGEGEKGFGFSCSISGDWMVVGEPYDITNALYAGASYMFYNSGGTWVETQKLLASDGGDGGVNDYFGYFCSISGNWVVVGAYGENTNGNESGAAYVFYNSGGTWVETQKLLASDGEAVDYFGWSCSIFGDWMIVGAYGEDTNGSIAGASYVFYNGGTWGETQKLLVADELDWQEIIT